MTSAGQTIMKLMMKQQFSGVSGLSLSRGFTKLIWVADDGRW